MSKTSGSAFIDQLMESVGKIQTKTTDTNYRIIATNWFNQVIRDISSREKRWKWLEKTSTFPTVESQLSYDLPSDIDGYNIFSLKQTETPITLKYIDQRRFDQLEPDPTETEADPEFYTVYASSLRLFPTPSQEITMTLRYLKTATALADDDETLDIPEKWDSVLLDGAKVHAFNYEPEWGSPKTQIQLYEAGIARMLQDNSNIQDDDGVSETHPFGVGLEVLPRFNPRGDFT